MGENKVNGRNEENDLSMRQLATSNPIEAIAFLEMEKEDSVFVEKRR